METPKMSETCDKWKRFYSRCLTSDKENMVDGTKAIVKY